MRNFTKNKVQEQTLTDREKVILDLKKKHEDVLAEIENKKYNDRAYINLPLTLFERTFFDMVSNEVFHLNQTSMMRKFIHCLMDRHPDIVSKTAQQIDEL